MSNCIKSKRKLIKGQHPLKHFIFYLDIENYTASKQIEEKIVELGGRIAFFFAETVTHIITDKNENKDKNNSNLLNSTLITPVECIKSNDSKTKSRADEMLQRVRIAAGQQQQEKHDLLNKDLSKNNLLITTILSANKLPPTPSTSTPLNNINKSHIKDSRVWDSKHAINILNKLINEREKSKLNLNQKQNILNLTKNSTNLKECYIKIESFEKFYRPYYKNFAKWPKINLKIKKKKLLFNYQDTTVITNNNSSINQINNLNDNNKTIEDTQNINHVQRGTATTSNCINKILNNNTNNLIEIEKGQLLKNIKQNINTTNDSDEDNLKKKCGFCELCKIEYDNLNKHLISDSHKIFSENSQNYLELDTIINDKGLNFENFLKISNKFEPNLYINNINNIITKTTKETGTNNESNAFLKEGTIIKTNNNQLKEKNIGFKSINRKDLIDNSNTNCSGSIANRTRNSIDRKNLILNEIELQQTLPGNLTQSKNQYSPTKIRAKNLVEYSKKPPDQFIVEDLGYTRIHNNLESVLIKEEAAEQNNFLLCPATINYKRNSVKMTKCNGINKNLTKRLKADEVLIDRHYFRETRQSMCKKNLYSVTLPSAKAPKTPIRNSKCNNIFKKSTITTRKSSPSKKSYYEAEGEEDDNDQDEEDDDDDDDDDVDFIDKNVTAPANVFHSNLRSQQKPNNCTLPSTKAPKTPIKNSKCKKISVLDSKNSKPIEKPITLKFKKIRQTELSVLNGEAENFMFPKRLEQRKRSGEDSSSDDDEPTKKKMKNCQASKFNDIPSPNSSSFNNSNKNKSIIQFCSNEKILEKVNKTSLKGDVDKYRFAFEKVPKDELWYNVFRRQDTSKEHVFEYYGSTAYRKLPYEMGPLPALERRKKCVSCKLMENNLFKNESRSQIILKDIDLKKEILDNQHQQQVVDDEKVSNNSIENEINKSTSNDITSKSNSKKLLKRDSSKSLLESYDIPRKSPREHASTLAILSCLLNSKNSSSGSENENGTSQNSIQTSTKLINSDESVILNYKRRPKKSLKLSKSLLENRINSTLTNSSNLDEKRSLYSPLPILEQKKTNLKSNEQSTNSFVKQSGRPMHWKQRPKAYSNQNAMNNGSKYENPVELNLKINHFLEKSSSVFPDDNLDILNSTSLLNPILDNETVRFSNDLNLIDLMDESLLKQQKLHFNKLNTNVVKKRKNNNKTGWPKKKKILTRQQKRKSSLCENDLTNCNEKIIINTNIETEFVSVDTISTGGEDNVDDKISSHETDDDDTTTLKNDEYLSAESNLDDNEMNSIPSIESELTNCCKYCGVSSKICDEQCINVIANNKNVRASPVKQESPPKQSPIKSSPRKLRKPRGRWYRER